MGELVVKEVLRRLDVFFGIVDLFLVLILVVGDFVVEILEEIGFE